MKESYDEIRTCLNKQIKEIQETLLKLRGLGSTIMITQLTPGTFKLFETKSKVEK